MSLRRIFARLGRGKTTNSITSTASSRPSRSNSSESTRLSQYNSYDARTLFSDLLRRAEDGEVIVIARYGRPVAQLGPFAVVTPRRPGVIRANVIVNDARARDDRV